MDKIFVYGTLLEGCRNWDRFLAPLEGQAAFARGIALHMGPGYPYARWTGLNTDITLGEIFWVNPKQLRLIDRLENIAGGHYHRFAVQTSMGRAWAYFAGDKVPIGPQIPSGDWLAAGGVHIKEN